jgi:hypothetical protein
MIFLFEAVPESIVRRYFLQVKKLTFKRAPGSRMPFCSTDGWESVCVGNPKKTQETPRKRKKTEKTQEIPK